MKKLLYTLLIGLVVISCEKDMDSDVTSIAVPSQDVMLQERFDAFNALIGGMKFDSKVSTAKGGDNGDNWLELAWFNSGSEGYVYLRPDNLGNGCYDGIADDASNVAIETYTYDSTDQRVNIQIGDADGNWFNIPESLQTQYGQAFGATTSSIYFADFVSSSWSVRFGSLPSVTVND